MSFNFGTQYNGSGSIIRTGAYGKTTPFLMTNSNLGLYDFFTENFRSIIEDGIVKTPWANILSKPTTLAGYGITNAVATTDVVTTATANKILRLNASGKLPADITGDAATLGTIGITGFSRLLQAPSSNITDFNDLPALFALIPGSMGTVKDFSVAVSSGTAIANAPYATPIWGFLNVTGIYGGASSGWIFLRFRDTSNRIYERQWVNGTWGNWLQAVDTRGAAFTSSVSIENGQFVLRNAGAPVDSKNWGWIVGSDRLVLRAINDTHTADTPIMSVTRSGMTINSVTFPAGKIGIGGSPVETTNGKLYVFTPATGNSGIMLHATATGVRNGFIFGSGHAGYLDFNSDMTSGVRLSSQGPLMFGTNTNAIYGESVFTEQMRLTTAGNLGVGTPSPISLVHFAKTSAGATITIERKAALSDGNEAGCILLCGGNVSNANAQIHYSRIYSYAESTVEGAEVGAAGITTRTSSGIQASRLYINSLCTRPGANNAYTLGTDAYNWAESYVHNGVFRNTLTIGTSTPQTSHRIVAKTTIADIANFSRDSILTGDQRIGGMLFYGGNASSATANIQYAIAGGICESGTVGSETGAYAIYTRNAAGSISERFRFTSQAFRPGADNAYTVGNASHRLAQIFAASATINTSDERAKTDIEDLELGRKVVKSLRAVKFKYRERLKKVEQIEDGTEIVEIEPERTETRVVTPAQYETVEIEPAEYETVVIQPEEIDEEGNVISEAVTKEVLIKEAATEERLVSEAITENIIIPAKTEERPKYKEVITSLPGVRPHAGFIAQEVRAALEALGYGDIGVWTYDKEADQHGLRYEEITPFLALAIQELDSEVEAQAAKIEEQEVLLNQLMARIEALENQTA